MSIAFVNGAFNDITVSGNTVSVNYSPTAGNIVLVFLNFANTVSGVTCTDSNSVNLTPGAALISTQPSVASFYYVPGSGVTSFTANWTTNRLAAIVVVEYSVTSGTITVNSTLSGNTGNATGTTPSLTVTTQDANDVIVAGFGDGANNISITNGTARKGVSAGSTRLTVADNTSGTAGSLTIGGTITSTPWCAVLNELRFIPATVGTFTPPAITSEFHWGGGDTW